MLPSTGYFKTINCPFYDSGLCERPYCHFRHVKKDNFESQMSQSAKESSAEESAASPAGPPAEQDLNKVITDAVRQFFMDKEMIPQSSASDIPESVVTQVVEELKPVIKSIPVKTSETLPPRVPKAYLPPTGVPQYKPTPISELKKRHIPVPYTPLPAPRGGSKVQKRNSPAKDQSGKKKLKTDSSSNDDTDVQSETCEDSPRLLAAQHSTTSLASSSSSFNGFGSEQQNVSYVPSPIQALSNSENSTDYVPSARSTIYQVPEYCPTEKSTAESEPNYVPEGSNSSPVVDINYTPTDKAELDDDIDISSELDILESILDDNFDTVEQKEEEEVKCELEVPESNSDTSKPKKQSSRSSSSRKHGHRHSSRSHSHHSSSKKHEKKQDKHHSRKHSTEHEHRSSSHRSQKVKKTQDKSRSLSQGPDSSSTVTKEKPKSSSKHHERSKSHSGTISTSPKASESHRKWSRHDSHGSKKQDSSLSSSDSKANLTTNSNNGSSYKESSPEPYIPVPDLDMEQLSGEETDEDQIAKECYKIFKEYEPTSQNIVRKKLPKSVEQPKEEEAVHSSKKRVAHEGAQVHPPRVAPPPKPSVKPVHPLQLRMQKIRQSQESKEESVKVTAAASSSTKPDSFQRKIYTKTYYPSTSFPSAAVTSTVTSATTCTVTSATATPSTSSGTPGRRRIAHVPNVSMLLDAKSRMQEVIESRKQQASKTPALPSKPQSEPRTVVQTVPKGGHRVAHTPSARAFQQPKYFDSGKVAYNVRQCYVDMLITEYCKINPDINVSGPKAVDEEAVIYEQATTKVAYTSRMSVLVKNLRRGASAYEAGPSRSSLDAGASPPQPQPQRVQSHSRILSGHGRGSWSVIQHPRTASVGAPEKCFYHQLLPFVLDEDKLRDNGYPRPHPTEKGMAIIQVPQLYCRKPAVSPANWKHTRTCCRCGVTYSVNQNGYQVKEESCMHHWGRLFQHREKSGWDRRYSCCHGDSDTPGCTVGACHVSDAYDPDNLRGFVKTHSPQTEPKDGDYGVYALDCEMSYTTDGLELTRVTVIDRDLNTVYESLVKPKNEIIDYNTRFSGITAEDMADVTTSIYEVQASLLSLIKDKTILIGHSLESDFKALKLIHDTVVDTSIVFPHKMGPPKKRALKTLARDYLKRIIQEGVDGHDSAEDAKTCMELMRYKVKEL